MVRCASDPSPSSSGFPEMTLRRSPGDDKSSLSSMTELPMIPTDHSSQQASISTSESMTQEGMSFGRQQVQKEPNVDSSNEDIENPYHSSLTEELVDDGLVHLNLVRSPSLPSRIERKMVTRVEESSHHGSRKLMRQTSLNPSTTSVLPPQHISKGMTPRHRLQMETKVDIQNKESHQSSSRGMNRTLSRRKTMSDLEIEELQGFKDLGFTFNKEDLSPSVVNIIPGLRDRSDEANNCDEDKEMRRPYLSEAWVLQRSSAPVMPNWVQRRTDGEDMKEQLKVWARAVASNVR
ncbi:uncharacterized protein LOC122094369 [Macadamia integrifolia]|uniref:uncharacterized protein LOC122094369 n=1 Tax=Macadamia integrifolia TaxID=60698 RepID=UPI001C5292F2|nr:uncharacterized protein LOC122094369 [Macadamia integrifolia]